MRLPWRREPPASDHPRPTFLRDYLYVDAERVRLLLAQLEGGVVEEVIERAGGTRQRQAQGTVFGSYLQSSYTEETGTERSRSLQDALFFLFEEAATRLGLFAPSTGFSSPDEWYSGRLHERLVSGQLVRSTGPTQLLDNRSFQGARRPLGKRH